MSCGYFTMVAVGWDVFPLHLYFIALVFEARVVGDKDGYAR